ncbi:hypothetical protein LSTR_LSTR008902 [Laodelphax striatellus]|uniref:Uncharacterized protein n=1 Tax=Laodelphax striatellus TaxID=195883 RepID=A0A482WLI9_LAOST|nr:hypothetical protein LSTR_LSTR008902 [Laodelphax striatellus]
MVSPPAESISRIPDFLSENKICVPSSSKTITTEVEDVKNDLLTQAPFVKPNVPSKIKISSVIGSPSESSVETMSQIQHFISNNKMCAPSSSKKINTEAEDVKNDLLTQALFVKPNVLSKR